MPYSPAKAFFWGLLIASSICAVMALTLTHAHAAKPKATPPQAKCYDMTVIAKALIGKGLVPIWKDERVGLMLFQNVQTSEWILVRYDDQCAKPLVAGQDGQVAPQRGA